MTILTLDFETYYDQDYSLRKMTTEAYVRDKRFEMLCVGVKENNSPARAFKRGETVEVNAIPASGMLCHHAHFDGLILSHHFGLRPAFWFDTLSMARLVFPHNKSHSLEFLANQFGLGIKTVPYEDFKGKRADEMDEGLYQNLMAGCKQDVELTYQIYKKLLPLVPKEELKIIDMTIRMFTEPVLKLDRDRLTVYVRDLQVKQEELLAKMGVTKTDLASADKFAKLLESWGVEPPTKISPRTKKVTYAFAKTDQGFLDLVNHEAEEIRLLAEARLSTKSTLGETRAGRLLGMSERGNLSVYLKYYGAHTGRWSGGDKLNFQNFPRGGEIRKSLLAPEGFVLCVLDLAQIECRMLCWLAQEKWVLEAFRDHRDLYAEMATDFYGRVITKEKDPNERFLGKTLVLGAGFGVGWKKLQGVLKMGSKGKVVLSDEDAKKAVKRYRGKHPNVVKLWNEADYVIKGMCNHPNFSYNWGPMIVKGKQICLPNGACLDYQNLTVEGEDFVLKNPKGTTKLYGGKLVENVVQALARIVMSQAMLKISGIYKVVTTTHDEIVYLAPAEEADIALEIGMNLLKKAPAWCEGLPLDAEGGYDVRYSK